MIRFCAIIFAAIFVAGSARAESLADRDQTAMTTEKTCVADPRVLKELASIRDLLAILDTATVVAGEAPAILASPRQ